MTITSLVWLIFAGIFIIILIWAALLAWFEDKWVYSKIQINAIFFLNIIIGIVLSTLISLLIQTIAEKELSIIWKIFNCLLICGLVQFIILIHKEPKSNWYESYEIALTNILSGIYLILGLALIVIGAVGVGVIPRF